MIERAQPKAPRPFTGWHMFAIMIAFFGVVVAVNFTMARLASQTFGGVVVKNSYVASQEFNRWLDEARNEKALGWSAVATRMPDNRVAITLAAVPLETAAVSAVARHPLGKVPDQQLTFVAVGPGRFISHETLPSGRWRLRVIVSASGHNWRQEQDVR